MLSANSNVKEPTNQVEQAEPTNCLHFIYPTVNPMK